MLRKIFFRNHMCFLLVIVTFKTTFFKNLENVFPELKELTKNGYPLNSMSFDYCNIHHQKKPPKQPPPTPRTPNNKIKIKNNRTFKNTCLNGLDLPDDCNCSILRTAILFLLPMKVKKKKKPKRIMSMHFECMFNDPIQSPAARSVPCLGRPNMAHVVLAVTESRLCVTRPHV